jgi:hypothetical protein
MNGADIQMQRDQALACMTLALCISLAVFLSVFGRTEKLAIDRARNAAATHEVLLKQSADVLQQNQSAFSAVRAALENIKQSQKP